MTTDDSCDCSICVPPQPKSSTFDARFDRLAPQTCGHAPDVQCENCRSVTTTTSTPGDRVWVEAIKWDGPIVVPSPFSVREVCSVVGGLHGCDGSPHTPLLPVPGDGEGAAVVVQEIRDNLPPVRLEG